MNTPIFPLQTKILLINKLSEPDYHIKYGDYV